MEPLVGTYEYQKFSDEVPRITYQSQKVSQETSSENQSCQRGVSPEAVSKRNDSFGVSKFASE